MFNSYNCRWLLRFKFADITQAEWCSAFDDVGNEIMQMTAKEMETTFKENFDEAEKFFRSRQFTEWTASILIKEDTWNDEVRMRYSVNKVEEIDYVKDSRRLLDELRAEK